MNTRLCAAKKLHGVFSAHDVPPKEKTAMAERFEKECHRILQLKHTNIVEMIGVHFDPATQLPTLVMELMDTSLRSYLDNNPASSVTLSTKYRILLDVASGLVYLHTLPPPLGPIVHRDLTSSNILLALGETVVAKIADLGQAKNDPVYATSRQQLSQVPGNEDHMPPEAWFDKPVYTTSLDIFSFGVVMLHTLAHEWPTPLGRLVSATEIRLEVNRRKSYIDKISSSPLKLLVKKCLNQEPKKRPITTELFRTLYSVSVSQTGHQYTTHSNTGELLPSQLIHRFQQQQAQVSWQSPWVSEQPSHLLQSRQQHGEHGEPQPGQQYAIAGVPQQPGQQYAIAGVPQHPGQQYATAGVPQQPDQQRAAAGVPQQPGQQRAAAGVPQQPGQQRAAAGVPQQPGQQCATAREPQYVTSQPDQQYANIMELMQSPVPSQQTSHVPMSQYQQQQTQVGGQVGEQVVHPTFFQNYPVISQNDCYSSTPNPTHVEPHTNHVSQVRKPPSPRKPVPAIRNVPRQPQAQTNTKCAEVEDMNIHRISSDILKRGESYPISPHADMSLDIADLDNLPSPITDFTSSLPTTPYHIESGIGAISSPAGDLNIENLPSPICDFTSPSTVTTSDIESGPSSGHGICMMLGVIVGRDCGPQSLTTDQLAENNKQSLPITDSEANSIDIYGSGPTLQYKPQVTQPSVLTAPQEQREESDGDD